MMVESHTKEGVQFFTPTNDTNALPPTPNFGGGAARHVTLLSLVASDPGIRGLPPSYMSQTAAAFQNIAFNFNRPINYSDVTGYKETHGRPTGCSPPPPRRTGRSKHPLATRASTQI
jgi:hypothetical protein